MWKVETISSLWGRYNFWGVEIFNLACDYPYSARAARAELKR